MDNASAGDDEVPFDGDLSEVFFKNYEQRHSIAPTVLQIFDKEAITGGLSLQQLLERGESGECKLALHCQPNEAIVCGSICFKYTGRLVEVSDQNYAWQSSNKDGAEFFQIGSAKVPHTVPLPPLMLNGLFLHADILVNDESTNFASTFGSTLGNLSAQAVMHAYAGQPEFENTFRLYKSHNLGSGALPPYMPHSAKSTDVLFGFERLYHPTNVEFSSLIDIDYREEDTLKCWPVGCPLTVKLVTKNGAARKLAIPNQGSSKTLTWVFDSVVLTYKTVEVYRSDTAVESSIWSFAGVEITVDYRALATNQATLMYDITTGSDYVPHFIIAFVGRLSAFSYAGVTAEGPVATGEIATAKVLFNGSSNTDFMTQYPGYTIDLSMPQHRMTMIQNWIGRAVNMQGPDRHTWTVLERQILSGKDIKMLLLVTDSSTAVHRESSSGHLSGSMQIVFNFKTVPADSVVWVVKFGKQDIGLRNDGGGWTLDLDRTRAAFTYGS